MSGNFELKCGTENILPSCVGATVPFNDAGFEMFVNQGVSAGTSVISAAKRTIATELSLNQFKALHAAGCAVTNLGTNFWHFIAAVYYGARQFGYEKDIETQINEYYPKVCTCNRELEEIQKLQEATGIDIATIGAIDSACSETAQAIAITNGNA